MEELRRNIEDVLAEYTGRFGIVIAHPPTGDRLEINPHMIFPSASIFSNSSLVSTSSAMLT